MATATRSLPAFVSRLAGETPESRLAILKLQHPAYKANQRTWSILLDAFEGQGGFLDGGYLWPYPREENSAFIERQQMARYHNYLEALVDLYVRFMFTQGVNRKSGSEDYNAWIEDVDGAGTKMNDFLKRLASVALVNGHAGALVDKTDVTPTGPTKADEQARVVASVFTATAMPDWRYQGNSLQAVKLLERAPDPSITAALPTGDAAHQYLLWDRTGWARFDAQGELLGGDVANLDLVPLVLLRPKPSQLSQVMGRALVSNANIIRALFNRASEEDQVLRDQAFSVLTISVDKDGNVDETRAQLGNVIGTAKALIVKGTIDYKTPDMNVPTTIRNNSDYLVQEMYRAAHCRYRNVTARAESGEAIRMDFSELNEMLQGFAKALAQTEREIARCYFAWTTPDPVAAQAAFDAADVQAEYPSEFFLDSLMADLQAWVEGIQMGLGLTMTQHIKKKAVRRIDPELAAETLTIIDKEIEALPDPALAMAAGPFPPDRGQPQDGVSPQRPTTGPGSPNPNEGLSLA